MQSFLSIFLIMLSSTLPGVGQVFNERYEDWPVDLKINGKILIAGDIKDSPLIAALLSEKERSHAAALLFEADVPAHALTQLLPLFPNKETIVRAEEEWSSEVLNEVLQDHRLVVLGSENALSEDEKKSFHTAQEAFSQFIRKGGILITLGPISEIVSASSLPVSDKEPLLQAGLNLIPDVILELGYDDKLWRNRLLKYLEQRERSVGIGLADETVLMLSGRKIRVAGSGGATFLVAGNENQEPREQVLTEYKGRSKNPDSVLLDLTQWRREAIDRTLPPFPSKDPRPPSVENGTLIIVGGGGTPRGLTRKMIDLAGGLEDARLVYIPCSENDTVAKMQRTVENWKKMGVKHATYLHTKDRDKANSDEDFLKPLKEATGLYFGGGRQWNFSDSYYGTKAHQLMKDVLKRGGVIMGSSAGASIQGRYLARATPIGNHKIIAFGYERGGLGFLDGVAIDQHFTQRNRFKDLSNLVEQYPQLLGIGIDESTALVVQKSEARVVGKGRVFFYDRNREQELGQPDFTALSDGAEYDLVKREVLKTSSPEKED